MNVQVIKKHQTPLVWDAPLAGLMETVVGFEFLSQNDMEFIPKNLNILHRAGTYVLENFHSMTEQDVQYHIGICEVGIKDVYTYGLNHFGSNNTACIKHAMFSLTRLESFSISRDWDQFTKLAIIATRAKLKRLLQL